MDTQALIHSHHLEVKPNCCSILNISEDIKRFWYLFLFCFPYTFSNSSGEAFSWFDLLFSFSLSGSRWKTGFFFQVVMNWTFKWAEFARCLNLHKCFHPWCWSRTTPETRVLLKFVSRPRCRMDTWVEIGTSLQKWWSDARAGWTAFLLLETEMLTEDYQSSFFNACWNVFQRSKSYFPLLV